MVQIKKDDIVLEIPRSAYEADYKNYGWKIIGEEQQVEKQVVAPITIENEKVEHNTSNKNKNK